MENPTLVQLQQILTNNAEEAASIQAKVNDVRDLLDDVQERLNKLVGAPQPKQQKSLKECIKDVLDTSNSPLTVKEIAELVLENGYKTTSVKHFNTMVLQALTSDTIFKRKTRLKTKPARFANE